MLFQKKSVQRLPVTVETIWQFLSDPNNLGQLTPPEMRLKTISPTDRTIYPGQIIAYQIKPLLNIGMSWVTEITHVSPGKYFVDEQRFGPYAFWHHQHFIHEVQGGAEITDVIHYKLPLGFIGQMVHPWLVEPKLNHLFQYRKQQLLALFGEFPST